jgi:N-carbamoylputrescine amidase
MGSLKIAAIQHAAKLGKTKENIAKVNTLIEEAASRGAQLIALPEMGVSGYTLNREMWMYSEPVGGLSEKWLQETAKRLNIYLCAGLIQHEGCDFYNTYLIADPEGETIGRVHKTQTEYLIHKPGTLESHIIETSLGRIGVGICADNHRTFFLDYMRQHDIDIMLQPHASPTFYKAGGLVKEQDVAQNKENVKSLPSKYAEFLGVVTVFINQTGYIEGKQWPGITGYLMDLNMMWYMGSTMIVEPGKVLAQMEREEGVIVSDVIRSRVKSMKPSPDYYGWVHPGSALLRRVIMPMDISLAKAKYSLSLSQRRKLTGELNEANH